MEAGFSRISVEGYRRLRSVDVRLRPINVLIGANGVGKTSFLEVFRLMARAIDRKLQSSISELGGMASLLTADGKTGHLALRFETRPEPGGSEPRTYRLQLNGERLGFVVQSERWTGLYPNTGGTPSDALRGSANPLLMRQSDEEVIDGGTYNRQESALVQGGEFALGGPHWIKKFVGISEVYRPVDVSARAPIRTPQTISPAQTPGLNGEDLVSCLYTIRETDSDRFQAIENALTVAFPTFDGLNFPAVAAGRITLGWRDRDFTRVFDISELSEGTLRFLWLTTLLQSPGLPQVTLIDEPEVSLHPEMLQLLTELMREASSRTQLIVGTHSDRFIRFLKPEEILACDYDQTGGLSTRWADDLDLKDWLEDYTLDQLWGKGLLGGRS